MNPDTKIKRAEDSLGVTFKDKDLLKMALTHRSFAYEASDRVLQINEKLEFLGDAVLGFVITDFIFRRYPRFSEGDLAKLRANLVNAEVLAAIAQEIALGECVLLGRGAELTGGRERISILSDCLEAIFGAIYLDQGLGKAQEFILKRFKDLIMETAQASELADFKTNLQEVTVQKLGVMPEYKIVREEGPIHERVFFVEVLVAGKVMGQGQGKSKKKAEREAAKKALAVLREDSGSS